MAATWKERSRAPELSPAQFATLCADAVREALPDATVSSSGHLELRIEMPGGAQTVWRLGNAWSQCCAGEPADRERVLDGYLANIVHLAADASDPEAPDADAVVPLIKDDAFMASLREQLAPGEPEPWIAQRFVADLWVVFAFDRPRGLRFLTSTDPATIGLAPDELLPRAVANLRRLLPEVQLHHVGPTWMFVAGGTFESSLLLFDEMWLTPPDELAGEIVAVVPSRDVLMFTSAQSPEGLFALRRIAADIEAEGDHLISGTLLVRRDGAWQRFGR